MIVYPGTVSREALNNQGSESEKLAFCEQASKNSASVIKNLARNRMAHGCLTVPQKYFLGEEAHALTLKKGKRMEQLAADHAKQANLWQRVSGLIAKVGHTECPVRPFGQGDEDRLQEGKVTPTSFLLHYGKNDPRADKLMNCYVTQVRNHPAVIRTGVIDTDSKREKFVEVLNQVKGFGRPVRIVSNQLNSFESESGLIERQHIQMAKVNQVFNQNVVHINTASNRLYHITKIVRKIPLIGTLLERLFLDGEIRSREMNLEAWPTYLKWIHEDAIASDALHDRGLGALTNVLFTANLQRLQSEIQERVVRLGDPDLPRRERKRLDKEISERRGQLREELLLIYREMPALILQLEARRDVSAVCDELYQKIFLLHQILSGQLNVPDAKSLGRGHEKMAIQELNDHLGVVSAMNCKSGLDRTGYLYALKMAMHHIKQIFGQREFFALMKEWGSLSRELNQRLFRAETPADLIRQLKEEVDDPVEWRRRQQLLMVMELRDVFLHTLLKVCLPITVYSTGLAGLKWGDGITQNLMPLNFLPTYVVDERGEYIKIVEGDRHGDVMKLTPAGERLLTQLSKFRGS